MPTYTFCCSTCEATGDVVANSVAAVSMELICTRCGGSMTKAPVLVLNVMTRAATGPSSVRKSCGHDHACHCHTVKLTRPNPFAGDLLRARGIDPVEEAERRKESKRP